jgi:asparagine synthase (glutamine-hydrolysing)
MSGFCGWLGGDRAVDSRGILERMAEALPNYGSIQAWTASGAGYGLALRSSRATGAFASDADTVVAIEGYPQWSDPDLSDIARTQGHAKALLAAYRRKGQELFDQLRGAFSFAVIDLSRKKALCAIDRFGIQTLCYARPGTDLVVFGSTTDAVRAYPGVGATVALQSIFDYLYFVDRVPAPVTIYREQRKLAPGQYLLAGTGQMHVLDYWQMPYRSEHRVNEVAAAEELRERLRVAVAANLAAEDGNRVGAFLSGGLDSSSVVGVAAALLPQKLKTFTIGFPVEDFDETYYADIAAKHFETQHQTYYLRAEDVVNVLSKAARIYDEPFANSSIVPAYHCARLAHEAGVDMMLAGDGGDELFAGNKRYVEDRVFDHYQKLPAVLRHGVFDPMARRSSFAKAPGPLGKVMRYAALAQRPVADRVTDNLFRARAPVQVLTADVLREINLSAPLALVAEIYDGPDDASKVQRMMQLDLRLTLADSDLRKVCRMCELTGVRPRFPLLDDDLAEFSARLPESLLLEGGKLRQFYKQAMRNFLPDAIIDKKKHGFGLPYLSFMNSHAPLRDLVCDALTGLKTRGYFRRDFLDNLIGRARLGSLVGHETAAWDLVGLELWFESRR